MYSPSFRSTRSFVLALVVAAVASRATRVHAQPEPTATPAEPAAATSAPAPTAVTVSPSSNPPAPPRALPDRLGPFSVRNEVGQLSVGFVGQLRTTLTNDGGTFGAGSRSTDTTVELRRLRLLLRASFLEDRLTFNLQINATPSALELLDVVAEARVHEGVYVRVGQFKTPFTLHRARSFQNLPMTDWDAASIRFGAERQIGAEVHTAPGRRYDASFGLFTGVNARASFARGIAEVYDVTMPNPSNLRAAQPPTQFHPELFGRFGGGTANADPLILSDPRGGRLRAYGAVSVAYDARPTEAQDFTARAAIEGMAKFQGVTVNAVGYAGFFTPRGGRVAPAMFGATVDATYRVLPRFEIAARYSMVASTARLRSAAITYVDALVAAAAQADQMAIRAAHANAGMLRAVQEMALGVNVPIIGRSLVFQMDAAILRTARVGPNDDAFRMRAQLQLGF